MQDFNINYNVHVRLTPRGRKLLMQWHADAFKGSLDRYPYEPPKEDADGWSRWQLWDLMQRLGEHCTMGPEPPFETTIRLEDPARRSQE